MIFWFDCLVSEVDLRYLLYTLLSRRGFAVPCPVPFALGSKSPLWVGSARSFLCQLPGGRQYDVGSAKRVFQLETLNCVWNVRTMTDGQFIVHGAVAVMKAALPVVMSAELACQQSQTFPLVRLDLSVILAM